MRHNLVENWIRPTKLGAKNPPSPRPRRTGWLFIGRESTGWQIAVIHTMVENVRRAGHDPEAYLKWVFERLPGMTNQDDLRALQPTAWIRLRRQNRRQTAA